MKRLDVQRWGMLRALTAIAAAVTTPICLLILAGCTNELPAQNESRGTGQALTLGTVSIEGEKFTADTRAASPLPDVDTWQGFHNEDLLYIVLSAESSTSTGIYTYNGQWTTASPAYWQSSTGNTLSAWWGPAAATSVTSPAVYNMPSTYETNTNEGSILNAWNGRQYSTNAEKWHITDLLQYSGNGLSATSPSDLELKHSMAQLCVELLPGNGVTTEELQSATVHLKQAAAYFTMSSDGRPSIHKFPDEPSVHPDVHLLKNGNTSLTYYALMLPGQTFGTDKEIITIHIGGDIYKYTPTQSITTTPNTCHELRLKVSRKGVSTLNITSTGWQSPTKVEATEITKSVVANNTTPGNLAAAAV